MMGGHLHCCYLAFVRFARFARLARLEPQRRPAPSQFWMNPQSHCVGVWLTVPSALANDVFFDRLLRLSCGRHCEKRSDCDG